MPLQFLQHGCGDHLVAGSPARRRLPRRPGNSAAPSCPSGTRYGNFVPTQVQATRRRRSRFGNQESEAVERAREGVARRSPAPPSWRSCTGLAPAVRASRASSARGERRRACALRRPAPRASASSQSPFTRTRKPAPARSTASARPRTHSHLAARWPLPTALDQLPQPALQRAEQRRGCRPARRAALRARPARRASGCRSALASSTKRGSTLATLSASGSPP